VGPCDSEGCTSDDDGNGVIDFDDLLVVLAS
jgi:hypothetical protein